MKDGTSLCKGCWTAGAGRIEASVVGVDAPSASSRSSSLRVADNGRFKRHRTLCQLFTLRRMKNKYV